MTTVSSTLSICCHVSRGRSTEARSTRSTKSCTTGKHSTSSGFTSSLFPIIFASRRRHTRLQGDWSSDVCSSDLDLCGDPHLTPRAFQAGGGTRPVRHLLVGGDQKILFVGVVSAGAAGQRQKSGNNQQIGRASCRGRCRSRWSPYH